MTFTNIQDYIKRKWVLFLICFIMSAIYFVSRLVNLTTLPIFTDEAIYIRWAQIAENDAAWRFISLTDGKQPLFIWLMIPMIKVFADPLFAGRIVSVFAGFFSLIGIGLLAREFFRNTRIGIFASFLYLISPFTLIYDRMALMDALVATFSIWSLYFAVLLVRYIRLDIALILAMSFGGGILTKTNGFLSIYLHPLTLLLFDFSKKNWKERLIKWIGLSFVTIFLSQIYYGILRLSPWYHMVSQKDGTFIYPFTEWITHPFLSFVGNLLGLTDWIVGYLTLPIVMMLFVSLLFIYRQPREKILLFLWFLVPFTALALFGKVLYPRFILFMAMPLLILAAWSFYFLWERLYKQQIILLLALLILSAYPLYVNSKILFSIVTAPIPERDSSQYINDINAGWGIREVVDILDKESEKGKIIVYTEGTFGLLPYGLEIYLVGNPDIKINGLWPIPNEITEEMKRDIQSLPTYYISNQFEELPWSWDAKLIAEYQKGSNTVRHLRLYQLSLPDYE